MLKRVFLLANKHAGSKADELEGIKDILDDNGIYYDLALVEKKEEICPLLREVTAKTYDAVAIYGGDGTVLCAIHEIFPKNLPIIILAGGTANGMARVFRQPLSAQKTMKLIVQGQYHKLELPVALWQGRACVFDLHYGLLGKIVDETDRELKQRIGFLAYTVEAFSQIKKARLFTVRLKLDGRSIETKASLCYIAMTDQLQMFGVRLFRRRTSNQYFDIAVCHTTRFWPLMSWYAQRLLFRRTRSKAVTIHQAKKVTVLEAPDKIYCDDEVIHQKPPFELVISQKSLVALTPRKIPLRARLQSFWLYGRTNFYRALDHLRRYTFGMSFQRFSQISDNFYIGGQPGRRGVRTLEAWGVTAVVSLQTRKPRELPTDITLLHLPTKDHTAIAMEDLEKGVAFINKQLEKKGKVYVHCHMGEGRAATMTIAYLLSQGMFLNDALKFVRRNRSFVNPNKHQIARLREFARHLKNSTMRKEGTR